MFAIIVDVFRVGFACASFFAAAFFVGCGVRGFIKYRSASSIEAFVIGVLVAVNGVLLFLS